MEGDILMDYLNASINFGIIRRRVQSLVAEASSGLGLTYSEISFLLLLFDKEGCSQEEMTGFLHVDKAAVTRCIKVLEKKDIIYRKKDDTDRRLKRLYITEEGRKLESVVKNIVKKIMDCVAEDFSENEKRIMLDGIDVMAHKLGATDYESIFGKREVKEQ